MKEDDVVKFAKALVDVKENLPIVVFVDILQKMILVIYVKINSEIVLSYV